MKNENQKTAIANFPELDPKICEQIKNLQEHELMLPEKAKLGELQGKLAAIIEGIKAMDQNTSPVSSEAQQVLDGIAVDALPDRTRRETLARQRTVLEQAIKLQYQKMGVLQNRLVADGCCELEPVAQGYIRGVVDSFEQLERSLKALEAFFNCMSARKYRADMRGGKWNLWPYERQALIGLGGYVAQRKAVWGLE